MADKRRRGGDSQAAGRAMRLVAVLVVVVVLVAGVVFVWWERLPTEQELRVRAGLDGKDELLVGVIGDMPGISLRDPDTAAFSGFDVDIARMVGSDLGFTSDDVRILTVRNEDRETMRAFDRERYVQLDLVVASFSITDEREALPEVTFSAPYLITELSAVTRTGHPPLQSLEDLRGQPVCTLTTSTALPPADLAGVDLRGRNQISDCVPGLLDGTYQAMVTDAAILAGFVAQRPKELTFHDIGQSGQERWGINTGGNEELRTLVNLALCRSRHDADDRRWEDAFDRHLRLPYFGQDVATDEQPAVTGVAVRTLPGRLPDACR
ncbi:MAG TPA: transporter substrate-binding domain-containing protein [Pseudonocardiaceae bacterium]